MSNVLVVAAHPDDETLGCGGTLAHHTAAGDKVHVIILSDGIGSRWKAALGDPGERQMLVRLEAVQRAQEVADAMAALGVGWYQVGDFPDQEFDRVPLLSIAQALEEVHGWLAPDIIYTHYEHDLNVDHRATYQAVMTAWRPVVAARPAIYGFEVPSSTEWAAVPFAPNYWRDITGTLEAKLRAFACYASENAAPPHPRSDEAIKALATYRGAQSGLARAEAFRLVRQIIA